MLLVPVKLFKLYAALHYRGLRGSFYLFFAYMNIVKVYVGTTLSAFVEIFYHFLFHISSGKSCPICTVPNELLLSKGAIFEALAMVQMGHGSGTDIKFFSKPHFSSIL